MKNIVALAMAVFWFVCAAHTTKAGDSTVATGLNSTAPTPTNSVEAAFRAHRSAQLSSSTTAGLPNNSLSVSASNNLSSSLASAILQAAISEANERVSAIAASVPELQVNGPTAIASFAPHKATFASTVEDGNEGPAIVQTPDGLVLRSRLLGLGFIENSSGEITLFAWPHSSAGEIAGTSVRYTNALEGSDADLVFNYSSSLFDQTVVIRKQIPDPSRDLGIQTSEANLSVVVVTEFIDPPPLQQVPQPIDLSDFNQEFGVQGPSTLYDETIYFGRNMRMAAGKSFLLGSSGKDIPSGKRFVRIDSEGGGTRWLLLETTPYSLIKAMIATLPAGTLHARAKKAGDLKSLLAQMPPTPLGPRVAAKQMLMASAEADTRPGVALDYVLVTSPLINVNLGGASPQKVGFAAVGQGTNDYWNNYYYPYSSAQSVTNLKWSDTNSSTVGLVVSNAPGVWGNGSTDRMFNSYIYSGGADISLTITNLPNNKYNFYLYGHAGAEMANASYHLFRAGVEVAYKGTSLWGSGWNSTNWEPGVQYVVFKNVAVTNQTITFTIPAGGDGYHYINGLQIIPAGAVPPVDPGISNLINIDFAPGVPAKVGKAAVGLATNDFWNALDSVWVTEVDSSPLSNSTGSGTTAGVMIRNAPGGWGNAVADAMYQGFCYSWDGGGLLVTLTNLATGSYDFYVYGHAGADNANGIYHLWTGESDCDYRGTSVWGSGWNSTNWDEGQQFIVYHDISVLSNQPVTLLAAHNESDGESYLNGMQIVYKGNADSNSNGLPDAWERYYFGNLSQSATNDFDGDGLSNLREYQLGFDPTKPDTDGNGILDGQEADVSMVPYPGPRGAYMNDYNPDWDGLYVEDWNWTWDWWDGDGWGGNDVYSDLGNAIHVSDLVPDATHLHWFERPIRSTLVRTGDVMFVYVNLDNSYPPSEVMLQWYVAGPDGNGTWEHRAYWGTNAINWGTGGTASRHFVTNLPAGGSWARLEVPASAVGLEGQIVQGIAFTLFGGRVAWDTTGSSTPDLDGNGLPDAWEMEYFGHIGNDPNADPDGDGLTNLQEFKIGTNPTVFSSDNSGVADGDRDADGDLLSNSAEMNKYHTDPLNSHSVTPVHSDSEQKLLGFAGDTTTEMQLTVTVQSDSLHLHVINTQPGCRYLVLSRELIGAFWVLEQYFDGSPAQTFTDLDVPFNGRTQLYVMVGSAVDSDGDGLPDGYEVNCTHTMPDVADSGNTGLNDGYKDPDGDGLTNLEEFARKTDPNQANVADLIFSPQGGNYPSAQNVSISSQTPGASIFYTINGQEPTQSSIPYSGSVSLSSSTTLKARAFKAGWTASDIENQSYYVGNNPANQIPTVTLAPLSGSTFMASDDVELLAQSADADGSISKIQIWRDNYKIAETTGNIVRFILKNIPTGTYHFTSRAIDDQGAVGVSTPVSISVIATGPLVTLTGAQPYFSTTPGMLLASVVGVNPGGVKALSLNGAALARTSGSFPIFPPLIEGGNSFTLVATDSQGHAAQATTSVTLDSTPPTLAISSPANNSSISTDRINVHGSYTEANLNQIVVNGVRAFATGGSFDALNVPLGGAAPRAVVAGNSHALALMQGATVVAWGNNSDGQCSVPGTLNGVCAISAGASHCVVLKTNGSVICWGKNDFGQCTVPATLSTATAVAGGGSHSLALRLDGTVVAWGRNNLGQTTVPTGLRTVQSIAAGSTHSLALKQDGTVVGWGDNNHGETTIPTGLSDVVAISAGQYFSLVLRADGTVIAWGDNTSGQTSVPTGLGGVVAISAGTSHALALLADGSVVGWGRNSEGQVSIPVGLRALSIASGGFFSLGLSTSGIVLGWGQNSSGQTTPTTVINGGALTATALDFAGNTTSITITVNPTADSSGHLVDPVQLAASPLGGFAPASVTFQVGSSVPGTVQSVLYDFDGNGSTDQTETTLTPISHTYSIAGQYFPVVTIVTSLGKFSSKGGWSSSAPDRLSLRFANAPSALRQPIAVNDPVDLKWTPGDKLYVLSGGTAALTEFDNNGFIVRALSGIGSTPSGLDVDSSGNVYVALTGINQVKKFIPTSTSFQPDSSFNSGSGAIGNANGSPGSGNSVFNGPFGVAVSQDGAALYVSDRGNHRVQKFTSSGSFLVAFGTYGNGFGQLNLPQGLNASSDGSLYLADSANNRICRIINDNIYELIGGPGTQLGKFQIPNNLIVTSQKAYVADTGNNRIQLLNCLDFATGLKLDASNLGLSNPTSITPSAVAVAVDPIQERIYIADRPNNRIVRVTVPKDDPLAVWALVGQNLNNGNLEGALQLFSEETTDDYRSLFGIVGSSKIAQDVASIPQLTALEVNDDDARYYFVKVVGVTSFLFTVSFVKENGVWKVRSF